MRGVFFIDTDTVSFFGGITPSLTTLKIGDSIISAMEIIDAKELERVVTDFLKSKNTSDLSLIICLTEGSYFQKDVLPHIDIEMIKTLQKDFIESVPFESVYAKYYSQQTTAKIIAVNASLINTFIDIFKKNNISVVSVIPIFALFPRPIIELNDDVGSEFVKHFKSLEEVSLPLSEKQTSTQENKTETGDKNIIEAPADFKLKKRNKNTVRLYGLASIFFLLIGVLIFMITNNSKSSSIGKESAVIVPVEASINTPTPEELEVQQKNELSKDGFVIEVLIAQDQRDRESLIVQKLRDIGYKNVVVKNLQAQVFGETTIVFKDYISQNQKEEIIELIRSIGYTVSILESQETTNDILIKIF